MNLKAHVSKHLTVRSMRRHRSRIGWRKAHIYSNYLKRCRREAPADVLLTDEIAAAVEEFRLDGITAFVTDETHAIANEISANIEARQAAGEDVWSQSKIANMETYNGDPWLDFPALKRLFEGGLGDFLKGYFQSEFKIFFGLLYHTVNDETPTGSQLWHSDSGPGICINVMMYLHDTTPQHGALEALPWETSLAIYEREKSEMINGALSRTSGSRRDRLNAFYAAEIERAHLGQIRQPVGRAGLVVPFLNNTLHRGGFPEAGHSRTAFVFHCYPSHRPTDWSIYDKDGIKKRGPYPHDPSEPF